MPDLVQIANRVVLGYSDKGTYGFDKYDLAATADDVYAIAGILNSMQEDAAVKAHHVITSQVV